MPLKIDHIGIVVKDLKESLEKWREIEGSSIEKFINERGGGIHHFCFEVREIHR